MTPGARIQAAVEVLSEMALSRSAGDNVVRRYMRSRRYIGSKDRRDITQRVWRVERHRARLSWSLDEDAPSARQLIFADSLINDDLDILDLENLCNGDTYTPLPLSAKEKASVNLTKGRLFNQCPPDVASECPVWLWPYFQDLFGEETQVEISALSEESRVDVRINTMKASRDEAKALLKEEGLSTHETAFSPIGLSFPSRVSLQSTKAFSSGMIEVQDEASQIAAMLVDPKPNHFVLDFCAGSGGKSLAIAAAMAGKGQVVATDTDAERLAKSKVRIRRSGIKTIKTRVLDSENTNWQKRQRKSFDRVLVDAPCSGTGTWRRRPDEKWRFSEKDLDSYINAQDSILGEASRFVRPLGRLIYVTCSLLKQENEDRVNNFLSNHEHFHSLSVGDIWKSVFSTRFPGRGRYLRLSPRRHKTDGFFVAIIQRRSE